MTNTISIHGIRLYGFHGCLDEEALVGGHYIVDVDIQTDFMHAAASDSLADTVDYCAVYDISKSEMQVRSKLIEQVCARIHNAIKEKFSPLGLEVKVTKVAPPMNGDVEKVSVTIKS